MGRAQAMSALNATFRRDLGKFIDVAKPGAPDLSSVCRQYLGLAAEIKEPPGTTTAAAAAAAATAVPAQAAAQDNAAALAEQAREAAAERARVAEEERQAQEKRQVPVRPRRARAPPLLARRAGRGVVVRPTFTHCLLAPRHAPPRPLPSWPGARGPHLWAHANPRRPSAPCRVCLRCSGPCADPLPNPRLAPCTHARAP